MNRIFVSVAAFVDPVLHFTINEMIKKARYPNRLRIGILDQNLVASTRYLTDHRIRYEFVPATDSQGVCWARALVQELYGNEELYLQIDSHMAFHQDWDVILESQLSLVQQNQEKSIISVYPQGFTFDANGVAVLPELNLQPQYVLAMHPKESETLTEEDPVMTFKAEWYQTNKPIRGYHVAGGMLFGLGTWVKDIPYDPEFYFHGEEQGLAVRAHTKGWNIYHPPIVPICHLYKQAGESYDTHHWSQKWEAERKVKWTQRQQWAKERFRDLLLGNIPVNSIYGLGVERDLASFAALSGIDYQNWKLSTVQPQLSD